MTLIIRLSMILALTTVAILITVRYLNSRVFDGNVLGGVGACKYIRHTDFPKGPGSQQPVGTQVVGPDLKFR